MAETYVDASKKTSGGAGGGLGAAVVADRKSDGTNGGTCTPGSWEQRDLNTIVSDTLVGTTLSVSSDQFTIDPGGSEKEYLIEWSAPCYKGDQHQARLYNVTDASVECLGSSAFSKNSNNGHEQSHGTVVVTLSASKTFRIEHRVTASQSTSGYGAAAGLGNDETYTIVNIVRVK